MNTFNLGENDNLIEFRENKNFSLWMTKGENLEALSEVLDMDLEYIKSVQTAVLDPREIILNDAFTNNHVYVTNNLSCFIDITHESELDLNIKSFVYISPHLSDDQKDFFDLHNEYFQSLDGFFGVEILFETTFLTNKSTNFKIVSSPKLWRKRVYIFKQNRQLSELSDMKKHQLMYWREFKKFTKSNKIFIKNFKSSPQNWINIYINTPGFWLTAKTNRYRSFISVDFKIKTTSFKNVYHQLFSERRVIETEFGSPLIWNEMLNGKESYISVIRENSNTENKKDWVNQFTWFADNLEKLTAVFLKRVDGF